MPYSQRTKWGIFSTCRTFCRWAMRYDLAKTSPFERMEPIPKGEAPKAILMPDEMRGLLNLEMQPYMRHWLILSGFCGLRTIEIKRMDWSAVDFDSREIHVAPDVIKRDKLRGRGVRERYVTIPGNALELLPRGQLGPVIPVGKTCFDRHVKKLANFLGYGKWPKKAKEGELAEWPHDCLRHSAASYMLALVNDSGKVAHWMGHTSPAMVNQVYARAVKREQAVDWFSIGLSENVIPIGFPFDRDRAAA